MTSSDEYPQLPLIKVVGISASGKSTLVKGLRRHGYNTRPVSQEHSNVSDLWQQFDQPKILIYLDVDLETQRNRRPDVTWDKSWLREENTRLDHARGHAELKINTAGLSSETVLRIALTFLRNEAIHHADHALPTLTATGSALQSIATTVESSEDEAGAKPLTRAERRKLKRKNRG